jgi:hypothetical protein
MIHVIAPNGLLVRHAPPTITDAPCGVDWTSIPGEARQFESPSAALTWAQDNAPILAEFIEKVIDIPVNAPRKNWGDLRFVSVGVAT